MNKSPDAFRTISEVADWLGIQAHVLRFWESKFNQVKPVKRAGGRRYYRPNDMQLLGGIKRLLYEDGMTIKGVQKILREQGVDHVIALSAPLGDVSEETAEPMAPDLPEAEPSPMVAAETSADPEPAATPEKATVQPVEDIDTTETAEAPAPSFTPPTDVADVPVEAVSESVSNDVPSALPETTEPHEIEDSETIFSVSEPEPEPEPAQAMDEDAAQEELPLASSETRPTEHPAEVAVQEEPTTVHAQTPVETAAKPRIIDAPDPPEESEILCDAGILSRLVALDRLDSTQLQGIALHVRALENCMNKLSGAA